MSKWDSSLEMSGQWDVPNLLKPSQTSPFFFRSTQSEWTKGDKGKKKAGLIGKLKKLTRGMSAERDREFGSGSDIRDKWCLRDKLLQCDYNPKSTLSFAPS